jgi:hypothetical protein
MRILAILATSLLAAYAAVATIVIAFDDHRYHTTMFAPVPGQGWHAPEVWSCTKAKIAGCTVVRYTYPDCGKFNPIQCWIYPNRGQAYDTLEYDLKGVKIEVRSFDLGIPATGPIEPDIDRGFADIPAGKIQIQVTITGKETPPQIDRGRVRLVAPCGPGVKRKPDGTFALTAQETFTLLPSDSNPLVLVLAPREVQTHILIEADRAAIQECTLRLRDAIGLPVPDVTFRAFPVAHYAIITAR